MNGKQTPHKKTKILRSQEKISISQAFGIFSWNRRQAAAFRAFFLTSFQSYWWLPRKQDFHLRERSWGGEPKGTNQTSPRNT